MGTQPQQMSRWPLVGRQSQLEAFTAAWADRRCRGVVIYGPAGVGKSRLAEECLARAVHEGWKGRRATASAVAAAVPLGAIAHLVPSGVDLSDPVKGFAAVAAVLAGPHRDRRWAVWVDDLHLLDATSAVLLRQLLDAGVVRLIATVRAGVPAGEAVGALTGSDAMHRIDLAVFDLEQTEAVLQAALRGPIGRRTLYNLHAASGGNALYLHELVLGTVQAGKLASDGEIWELTEDRPAGTPRLTELIEARLATAAPAARPVLELLAVAEPLPLADAEQTAASDVLADLEDAGLVQVAVSRRRTTVQLAHPLYGEVLRRTLPNLRRRTLLLQQADRTRAHGARRRDDALHLATWQLAATGTAEPKLLTQAAMLASHAHDYPQVISLLQALPDREHKTATRLVEGLAHRGLGDFTAAEKALADADRQAEGEPEILAVVAVRTLNLYWSGTQLSQALAVNEAGRHRIHSSAGLHLLDVNRAAMLTVSGQPDTGLSILQDVHPEVIDSVQDVNTWLYGLGIKTLGLALVGRTTEAITAGHEAYKAHRSVDRRAAMPHPSTQLIHLAMALADAGELQQAYTIAHQAFSDLQGETIARMLAAGQLGRIELLRGHADSARHWYAEAAGIARVHSAGALKNALAGIATTAYLLGDAKGAEAAREEAQTVAHAGYLAGKETGLDEAAALVASGHLREARALLTHEADHAEAAGHLSAAGWLLTDIGRLGGAAEVQERLTELADVCDGSLAPARAHLAAGLAAHDPDLLMTAANEMEAIGADLLAAEAATTAATAWQRAGHARRAATATQRAHACAVRCQGARTPLLTSAVTVAAVLTAREKEVALLAAAGNASKDIADTLHLSVRTVDNHLQHAYAKLGVTTRRELAETLGTTTTRRPTRAHRE
ncbi:helix-turn-helix transcriptional regulator [Streptomyces bobili]|uniref:helix-turn-helix transcriptional regulator n=1 Tax=Streptomyces bobili TaxID=67280 RepID=UPI0037F99E8E